MRRFLILPLALLLMGQEPFPTLTPMGTPWPSPTPTGEPTPKPLAFPTKITVTPSSAQIDVGGQVQLTVTMTWGNGKVSPNIANEADWTTSDENVAEVQGANGTQIWQRNGPNDTKGAFKSGGPVGEVNAMGPGTATITATIANMTATCKVTVKGTAMPQAPILAVPTATPGSKL